MKKKKVIKNGPGRPPLHPYSTMNVDKVNVREFETEAERLNARCAAHMVSHRHGKKFDTVDSVSKSGGFVITVKRVK